MSTRSYEQTWFRLMCGHNAPPIERPLVWERTKKRERVLRLVLDQKDRGMTVREIAQHHDWSLGYTRNRLRIAAWELGVET
jgi:hypothetical protein